MRIVEDGRIEGRAAHAGVVVRPVFSPDGTRFVASDERGGLVLRGRKRGERSFVATTAVRFAPSSMQAPLVAWSPDDAHLAVYESGGVVLRSTKDLAVVKQIGGRARGLAFGGGGAWLAIVDTALSVCSVPSGESLAYEMLLREAHEYFYVNDVAADPSGSLVAASDDGGQDETAMAMITAKSPPATTLFDVGAKKIVARIAEGDYVSNLAFDSWRRRFLGVRGQDVMVWSCDGTLLHRFCPYGDRGVQSLAIAEGWIVTLEDRSWNAPQTIDLWHPTTFERLVSVSQQKDTFASWLAASPDGTTLLTNVAPPPSRNEFPIQIWRVEA